MGRKFISNVKGVGVSSIIKEYYASTSSSELTGGTWMDNIPILTESLYLWSRWKVVLTNGETTTTEAVQEGIAGADLSNLAKVVGELKGSVEDLDTTLKKQAEDIKKQGEDVKEQFDDLNENLGAVAGEDVVPIEKGGHGKTTAKEGLKALGGISSVVAWENPKPASSYGAKTEIYTEGVEVTESDLVAVCFRQGTAVDRDVWEFGSLGRESVVNMGGRLQYESGEYALGLTRGFTANESNIQFATGAYAVSAANSNNTAHALIPKQVLVFKNVLNF